jgi:hypothetical protein
MEVLKMKNNYGWTFYSQNITKCKRCNKEIVFRQSNNGKWIAYDIMWISPDKKSAKAHGGQFHKCELIKTEYHQEIHLTDFDEKKNNYISKVINRIKENPCEIKPNEEIEIKGITYICSENNIEDTYNNRSENGYKIIVYKQKIYLNTRKALEFNKEQMEKAKKMLDKMFKEN